MTRSPEASEPFTRDELGAIIESSELDESAWAPGSVKFLAYAGAHISVLSGGWRQELGEWVYSPPIRSDAILGGVIRWNRPKTETHIRMPVARQLEGWLPAFLDRPRPLSRRRYNQVFDRIGRRAGLHLNPLRLRHTCAVYLHHEMHLEVVDVCRLIGVARDTVETYIHRPFAMIQQDLASRGF